MLPMEIDGDGEEVEGNSDAVVWDDGIEDADDLDDDGDDIARREMGQKNNSLCPLRVFLIPLN